MTVKLSSLRISAEMDADGFTAGATAIEQSSSRAGAAVKGLGESIQQTDVKIGRSGDGIHRLSMQYVEGFANQVKYEQGLRRINAALEKGAIDQAQAQKLITGMTAKLAFAGDAAQLAANGQTQLAGIVSAVNRSLQVETGHIDRNTAALMRNAAASKAARAANDNVSNFNTANIAAQFQDIGVTTAMGMNPLQIALQQGTQLSAVFEQMKASGQSVGTALSSALMGIVSPLSLVTIGAIAAGAAIVQWFMRSEDGADKLEKKLEEHAAAVRMIKDLYGETAAAAERAGNAGGLAFSAASIRNDAAFWQRELQRQAQEVTDKMRGDGVLTRGLFGSLTNVKDLRAAAGELNGEVEALIRTAGNGSADFDAFNRSLDAAFETARRSGKDVTATYNEIERVRELALAAFEVSGKFGEFAGPINQLQVGIASNNVDLEKFNNWVEQIGKQKGIQSQADQAIALGAELVKIAGYLQQIENARFLKTEQIRDRLASERMDTGQSYYQQRQREWELEDRILDAQTQQVKALTDQEKIAAAGALVKARNPVEGEQRRREILIAERQERERLDAAWQQGETQRARAREEDLRQAQQELELIGKTVGEVAALEFQWQAEAAARQAAAEAGRTVSDDEIKAIREQAAAVGNLAQKYAELQFAKSLQFDREQLGRSDEEQRVAEAMRRLYGDEYGKYMDSALAGQVRYNDKLRETRAELKNVNDAVKDTFTGLIDLLYSSGDATEKLIGAFAQLGKMFATLGAEKLYDFISGKSSSLFGNLPSVGGAGVSVANATASGTAIGKTIAPPIVESLNSGLDTYAAAIRKIESGSYAGNYSAVGQVVQKGMYAGDRAYGAYQVMGNNIASWTKEVLGQSMTISQFLGDKMAQDKVAYAKLQQSFDKFGNWADAISVHFSGRPVTRAGNASDGYNSVPEYLSKVQAAAEGYTPGVLKSGVSAGVQDGIKKISAANQNDPWSGLRQTSVAAGGGNMQAMLGVGGAALGAFAGGMQSGDPLSGALGGAFSGLGAAGAIGEAFPALAGIAGPIGIIGGAVLGLIGGLIGKSKQKKAELKQAQQELESQIGAITQLIATATGNFMGSFEKQFSSTTDEIQKAITLAEKAGNKVLAEKLKSSMGTFFERLTDQFERGFEGTLASMNAGLGFDGDFVKGSDAVEKMRESLVGFVNDAKFFAEANGDLGSMLDARKREMGIGGQVRLNQPKDVWYERAGGSSGTVEEHVNSFLDGYKEIGLQLVKQGLQAFNAQGGQFYDTLTELKDAAVKAGFAIDEQGKVTKDLTAANDNMADAARRAQEAAQATALAMLSGGKEFTEVEKAIQRLDGAAATLPSLLADLGMSAEDAARAIEHHLNLALDNLRKNYIDGLNASINDLSDFGFLNEIIAAQQKYQDRLIETAALGLDGSLALKEFNLSLAKTIKGADLTEAQISMLADAFPAIAAIIDTLAGDDTVQQVADAQRALEDAYNKEKSAIEQTISRLESFTKAIRNFRDEMRLDASSPLGQADQVAEAARQFREIATRAAAGDETAMDELTRVSQSYLDEARAYYASSEDYFKIWTDVDRTLADVEAKAGRQLSEQQKQLEALNRQVDGLITINDSVLTVAQAIANLNAALGARDKALQDQINAAKQAGQTYDPFITSLYKSVLNRAPDAEGAAYYTAMLKAGMSQDELRKKFIANAQPELDRGYPMFADGGYHSGGLRMVGERGPELEMTGPSRIWSAADTSRILSQAWQPRAAAGNDNSSAEMVKEIRALRDQVARLERSQDKNTAAVATSGVAMVEAVERGNDISRETGTAMKRVAARA